MENYTKAVKILEYEKILKMLADCALTEGAKERAYSLRPVSDRTVIIREQKRTTDAISMMNVKGMPPFGGVRDIRDILERAEKSAALSPRELLDIANVLHTTRSLISYYKTENGKDPEPSALDEDFKRLMPQNALEKKISSAIIAEDMIADEASPELSDIRRKIKNANNRIKDHLQKYINGTSYSKYLQENIVTMRNGRYVVPVKQEYKNEIKGLVHDTSGSGATVFIEPMAVVEANNELKELSVREAREIERILYELSSECAAVSGCILLDYLNITELAFTFAKAELSRRMDGTEPLINDKKYIKLVRARHPLLDKKTVVPISLELGRNYSMLVITGPNTGGKTVTLKTIGLFALMAQSGLHIPASAGSELCVFKSVLADIGDEQSIEQSLSTFSAHMVNIIDITKNTDGDSLVLFDELGAGTDPVEGAALATAILERVLESKALCAATTHYAELKAFAIDTDGVVNASCEFDVETLKPTYRLIIGTPGKSNAFEISKKLGLDEKTVDRAKILVSADSRHFEDVISQLEKTRAEMEAEKEKLAQEKLEYERFKNESEKQISENISRAEKEADAARAKAVRLIEGARVASEQVFSELEVIKKKKEAVNFAKELDDARRDVRRTLRDTETGVNVVVNRRPDDYELPRALHKGDEVLLCDMNKKAVLDSDPAKDGRVTVRLGNITVRTTLDNLMLCDDKRIIITSEKNKKKGVRCSSYTAQVSRDFKPELDLRGENGEDAWFMTDKYIDSAKMVGISTVRLIHGKGTGALKNALWGFLKKDPRVKSFRIGMYGEGDGGVTVVELK